MNIAIYKNKFRCGYIAVDTAVTYKEIEKEHTHNNTKYDPYDEGENRIRNGVLSGVIISKPEDGDVRCADGK